MARVSVTRSWNVKGGLSNLEHVLRQAAIPHGLAISETGGMLHLAGGSQLKMRVIGGWFANPKLLPKAGTVVMGQPGDAGWATITVTLEESMGFGVMDPKLKRKYDQALDTIANDFGAALSDAAREVRDAPAPAA